MNENLKLKLQALLDGELPPTEAAQVRRLAAADPAAAALLAELQAVKTTLRQHDPVVAVPESREFYWSNIARRIERPVPALPARPVAWAAHWRRWLAALAGASALAALLIVAHRQPASQVAYNEVSVTADGFEARTIRNDPSGLTFVFLHDTKPPADAPLQAPRVREEGSSFFVEPE